MSLNFTNAFKKKNYNFFVVVKNVVRAQSTSDIKLEVKIYAFSKYFLVKSNRFQDFFLTSIKIKRPFHNFR